MCKVGSLKKKRKNSAPLSHFHHSITKTPSSQTPKLPHAQVQNSKIPLKNIPEEEKSVRDRKSKRETKRDRPRTKEQTSKPPRFYFHHSITKTSLPCFLTPELQNFQNSCETSYLGSLLPVSVPD